MARRCGRTHTTKATPGMVGTMWPVVSGSEWDRFWVSQEAGIKPGPRPNQWLQTKPTAKPQPKESELMMK